ncbi:molybdopterin oxidoreductase family protein [Aestuariispira insulae]|uniref:Anaerobic selenocysteine-containing dehydrogenase n=1 Tax=Aestuariispira insulae TaxID=1461337 RepID=A0A3D9HKE4_9PROT|nr:molybdopterin oxidoreductase family protein [Aestuariispira insulae]RED49977.1 anaerobic selenocysteine-containing dehydrogenase [Aestuariispira insulae]
MAAPLDTGYSACPHDCPSTCALEVELKDARTIGRVRGAKDNDYTDGVICAKVARYAERIHHPDRLTQPLRRIGPKGSGQFEPIGWDEALDLVAEKFLAAEAEHGAEAVWPYYYAGTMGHVMRDRIIGLTHVKNYSRQHNTICTGLSFAGYQAGNGALRGADPRSMAKSDLIVLWGTNPVSTQVNVMTHAVKARKSNGTKIIVIDTYETPTAKQADEAFILRPGTDGALACAVMHILFRDGYADRKYLAQYADRPADFEVHLAEKTPAWASDITGMCEARIEELAKLIGENRKSYFRLGYGFARSRNGAVNMHAVSCIPVVTGAWQHEGGGALHSNSGIFSLDKSMITALSARQDGVRSLDQSRIGAVLCGDADALFGGPPVKAMLIQNTNPMSVAPDQNRVRAGFEREDLFVCVHEQFMTETARMADIVLPATMFLEHDDIYTGSGHQKLLLGPKLVAGPEGCRNNLEVIHALGRRLGADHESFDFDARGLIDVTLKASGRGDLAIIERDRWIECQPPFEEANFLNGFGHPDGKFRFAPDWAALTGQDHGPGYKNTIPEFPDHWQVIEEADLDHPFRLVTAPARNFLNSSFNETPTSMKNEVRPTVMIHEEDAGAAGIEEGDLVVLENTRGRVRLHAKLVSGQKRGVVIVESLFPNDAFVDGVGINALTGADAGAPVGGAAFHDSRVMLTGPEI